MIRLFACSSNAGKLRDFRLIASEAGLADFLLEPLPGLASIAPPEETGSTFQQNACLKALYYSQFSSEIVLADDSGIEVDALAGAPGVHSARYAGAHASDEANNRLLLRKMADKADRSASFVCAIALAQQGRVLYVAHGSVKGEILQLPQGEHGFGYDPLFFYPPFQASFADLTEARKFSVSHRGSALRQVVAWMQVRVNKPPAERLHNM